MRTVEIVVLLVALATVVAAFAGRLRVPAPSLLVAAGLGVGLMPGAPGSRPTARPAATSREGAGTRSRPANAATTVASATSSTTISTVRTPPGTASPPWD